MARHGTDCLARGWPAEVLEGPDSFCSMATALLASWEGLQMRRPNRLTTPLALCAAAALLLTGCTGGGGEESPSPTTSQSSSSSPSGTESAGGTSGPATPTESAAPEPATSTSPAKNIPAPEMPEAMKKNDQAGLEAALEYWWETEYYLKATGDAEPMKQVSMDECILCEDLTTNWPRIYEIGGWAEGKPAQVSDLIANVDNGGAGGTLLFSVTEFEGNVYRPGGELAENASGEGVEDYPWSGTAVFDEETEHWKIENVAAEER